MSWFISRAGQVVGPMDEAQLHTRMDSGEITAHDLLARPGDPEWSTAARLFPDRFPAASPGLRRLVIGLIVVVGLASWVGTALMAGISSRYADPGLALLLGFGVLAGCLSLLVAGVVSTVLMSRRSGGHPGHGVKIALTLSLLLSLPALAMSSTMLTTLVASDRGVDPHDIFVSDDGTIGLYGGMGRTLAHDLKRVLAAHSGEVLLELDNSGGILDAAMDAADLLQRHGPFTARVVGECASACALLLAAADRIELYADSRIGFHRPSSVLGGDLLVDEDETARAFEQRLKQAGFGEQVIAAFRDTPSLEMTWIEPATHFTWLPAFELLDDDGAVVAADARQVHLAAHLLQRMAPDTAELVALTHQRFPEQAGIHSETLLRGYAEGQPLDAVVAELVDVHFASALASTTPQAARAWLVHLVKLQDHYEWESPAAVCYGQAPHAKAQRLDVARRIAVLRGAAEREWAPWAPVAAGNADPARGPLYANMRVSRNDVDAGDDGARCMRMIEAARRLQAVPDVQLMGALVEWLD